MRWKDRDERRYEDSGVSTQSQVPTKVDKPDNIFIRIARSDNANLNKVQSFLTQNGFPRAKDRFDLAVKLSELSKKHGDDLNPSIVELHPDKKIFEAHFEPIIAKEREEIKKLKGEVATLTDENQQLKAKNDMLGKKSSADGAEQSAATTAPSTVAPAAPVVLTPPAESKNSSHESLVPVMAIVGVIGIFTLSIIAMNHNHKI